MGSEQVVIRRMKVPDVEAVAEIERTCFSTPWTTTGFLEAIEQEYTCFLVAVIEQQIVGYCGLYQSFEEGEITNIAVKKEHRHNGIAGQLLQAQFQYGQLNGISAYTLEVRVGNDAAGKLYEKYGFCEEGIRRNFYRQPQEDARIMWKRV